MHRFIISLSAIFVLGLPQLAWAKKVYSPHVEKGVIELETQTDITFDADPAKDGKVKQQFELAAGITDWWSSGLYAVYSKPANRSTYDYTSTKWENIFVLPRLDAVPLDLGLYAEYVWSAPSSNAADAVEAKLLLEDRQDAWRHTLNVIFKQLLSSGASAASLGYAWRSQYAWPDIELALEAYGTLGPVDGLLPMSRQTHLVGPVLTLKPWDDFAFEFGWLMDVNAGPSYGDLKVNLEYEF
ncbi:MAG: hypothetical protein R8L58_07125 [Mariprofundaceae bacterium]